MTTSPLLLILLTVPLALGAVAYFVSSAWRARRVGSLAFKRKQFMTGNELEFYRRLQKACAADFSVMAQVSMAALIDTELKPSHKLYWEVRRLFSGRICDFVLCDPRTMSPLVVVELDDKMHDFQKDKRRDAFVARAGLKTVRFWSRKKPEPAEIRRILLETTGLKSLKAI